jgi:ubiquinol-cytochrome c reductase cytochrome c subunit
MTASTGSTDNTAGDKAADGETPNQPEATDKPDQPDQPDRPEATDKPDEPGKPDQPEAPDKPAPAGRAGRYRRRTSSARRRRRYSAVVMALALAATGVLWSTLAPAGSAQETADASEAVRAGRALYLQGCSSCHALDAQGTQQGPNLIGVGEAAVDFQVSTGRMPLANPGGQAPDKPVFYSATEIDQLAAYIQSLGGGPEVPEVGDAELGDADLTHGGELYRANCAQCHQAAGAGAPLTYGKFAPALDDPTPVQVIEAMRTGPESMPVFGPNHIDEEGAVAVAAYIEHLRDTPAPGGHTLGKYGPVPEGLLAWLVGIGGLLAVCLWIGARQKR